MPEKAAIGNWWRTDKGAQDVTYTQFMGKDNVPFHTLSSQRQSWSGEPWSLSTTLNRLITSITMEANSAHHVGAGCLWIRF